MSKFEDHIYTKLKELFPYTPIIRQLYINYEGTRLYFDFYIKGLNLYIECQGTQHDKFTQYFHGNLFRFQEHKARDRLKYKYVNDNDGVLVYLYYSKHKDISSSKLMEVIHAAYYTE